VAHLLADAEQADRASFGRFVALHESDHPRQAERHEEAGEEAAGTVDETAEIGDAVVPAPGLLLPPLLPHSVRARSSTSKTSR
jgi:hypothetical protein